MAYAQTLPLQTVGMQMVQVILFCKAKPALDPSYRAQSRLGHKSKCIIHPTKQAEPYNGSWLLNIVLILDVQQQCKQETQSTLNGWSFTACTFPTTTTFSRRNFLIPTINAYFGSYLNWKTPPLPPPDPESVAKSICPVARLTVLFVPKESNVPFICAKAK